MLQNQLSSLRQRGDSRLTVIIRRYNNTSTTSASKWLICNHLERCGDAHDVQLLLPYSLSYNNKKRNKKLKHLNQDI